MDRYQNYKDVCNQYGGMFRVQYPRPIIPNRPTILSKQNESDIVPSGSSPIISSKAQRLLGNSDVVAPLMAIPDKNFPVKTPIISSPTPDNNRSKIYRSPSKDNIVQSSKKNSEEYKKRGTESDKILQFLKFKRSSKQLEVKTVLGTGQYMIAFLIMIDSKNVVLKFHLTTLRDDLEFKFETFRSTYEKFKKLFGDHIASILYYGTISWQCLPYLLEQQDQHYTIYKQYKLLKDLNETQKLECMYSLFSFIMTAFKAGYLFSDLKFENLGFDEELKKCTIIDLDEKMFISLKELHGSVLLQNIILSLFICPGVIRTSPICLMQDGFPKPISDSLSRRDLQNSYPYSLRQPYYLLFNIINVIWIILLLLGLTAITDEIITKLTLSELVKNTTETQRINACNRNPNWKNEDWWQNVSCYKSIYDIFVAECDSALEKINQQILSTNELFFKALLKNLIRCLRDNLDPQYAYLEAIHGFTSNEYSSLLDDKIALFESAIKKSDPNNLDLLYGDLLRGLHNFLELLDYYDMAKEIIDVKTKPRSITEKLKQIYTKLKNEMDNLSTHHKEKVNTFLKGHEQYISRILQNDNPESLQSTVSIPKNDPESISLQQTLIKDPGHRVIRESTIPSPSTFIRKSAKNTPSSDRDHLLNQEIVI